MSDPAGSTLGRAALAACLLLTFAARASAQYSHPPGHADAPAEPGIFTRTEFHMFASKLLLDDERFGWDTHFGGDLDVIDFGAGRLTFLADYNAVIGSEYRGIDPNQGNYTLEPSLSVRTAPAEVALVFHHVSRHLGDRAKTFALDWNVLGARAQRRLTFGPATADLTVGAGSYVQHSRVDYRWTLNGDLLVRRPLTGRAGAFIRAAGETIAVEEAVFGRGRQSGGKLEGGVKIAGTGGAIEVFGGLERRIDAEPLTNESRNWAFVGFRFLSK